MRARPCVPPDHERAMLPTNIRPGRNGWPHGQWNGGRAIHWPEVDYTSSPTGGGHNASPRTAAACHRLPKPPKTDSSDLTVPWVGFWSE